MPAKHVYNAFTWIMNKAPLEGSSFSNYILTNYIEEDCTMYSAHSPQSYGLPLLPMHIYEPLSLSLPISIVGKFYNDRDLAESLCYVETTYISNKTTAEQCRNDLCFSGVVSKRLANIFSTPNMDCTWVRPQYYIHIRPHIIHIIIWNKRVHPCESHVNRIRAPKRGIIISLRS